MADGVKYSLAGQTDTTNLLDYSTWTVDDTDAVGFSRNGLASDNLIISDRDPFGEIGPIWRGSHTKDDATNSSDGGWNVTTFAVDNTKLYRFSCWFKNNEASVSADGRNYFGTHGYGTVTGVYYRSSGANNTNPYFYSRYGYLNNPDEWMLWVGHVWPAGSGTGSNKTDTGRYLVDGTKDASGMYDFVWRTETTTANARSYWFYSNNHEVWSKFALPRIEIVDGTESSIQDLLEGLGGYSVTNDSNQGNFYFKAAGSELGDTSKTGYWSTITPPDSYYTLYQYKVTDGPSIMRFSAANFIKYVNMLSGGAVLIKTELEATTWLDTQDHLAWIYG